MVKHAGEFSDWINSFLGTMKGESSGDVPCGDCIGCCTSSKFVLVRPTDFEAISIIPEELLFPAPGLPKGYQLMGYDEQGHCPMFKSGKCSIYELRPETCKQYDCRVLAATGANIEGESKEIVETITSWQFEFSDNESRNKEKALKRAMLFLKENSEFFPRGYIPNTDSQISALAVRIYKEFINIKANSVAIDELVTKITKQYPQESQS